MKKPTTSPWIYLLAAILLEVTATLCIKAAMEQPALYAVVLLGYIGSFACLTLVLRNGMGLGVAYGIWGASGVALTAILSMLIFGEPITVLMSMGILLIIGGVLCVELGAQAVHKKREAA